MTREEFDEMLHARLQDEAGIEHPHVSYAVDMDDLDKPAVTGRVQFIEWHEGFWGDGEDYVSEVVRNPTWFQVTVFADAMIKTTGDTHHIFLEGITKDVRPSKDEKEQQHLRFGKSTYRNRRADIKRGVLHYGFVMGS